MTDNRNWRGNTAITVYGRRAVMEALEASGVEVEFVRVAQQTPGEFRSDLTARCRQADVELEKSDWAGVTRLSGDQRHDQGVAARIHLRNVIELEDWTATLHGKGAAEPTRLLAMDTITNPQNLGMIVRSAVAAGITGILWPRVGCPWVNGLVIKGSAATVYRVPIIVCHDLASAIAHLQGKGFHAAGLEADGGTDLFEHRPRHRAVFVIGSETTGISREVTDLLDERLAIPMAGGVESLNAAVAAALVCFHAMRTPGVD